MLLLFLLMFSGKFSDQENAWRAEREASMKSENSWLTIVGLYWLEEGPNRFGTDSDIEIVLPTHSTVAHAGIFTYRDGKVTYKMNRAQRMMVDGKIRNEGELALGEIASHNHLRMFLIERGGRIALRVRDLRARNFVDFKELDFYRPKEKYVVDAVFEPYDQVKTIQISTIIQTEIELLVPGVLKFEYRGKSYEILPTLETMEDKQFFIMLKDQTSGATTYGGGRYMYVPRPEGQTLKLNFNRAYNPPCAYTDHATCPLPPPENWLDFPIEAGERLYKRPGSSDH